MSTAASTGHPRTSVFSYIGLSKARRRSSVTLPHRERSDSHEKPDRHTTSGRRYTTSTSSRISPRGAGLVAWMNSGQRARWIKTSCLLLFVFLLIYYISPASYGGTPVGRFPGGDVATDAETATTRCTRSYSSDKPLVQFALMIDAGSTGSRIHVYRFNNCGPTPELENEVFEMTEKKDGGSGLSSYPDDPEAAARSLDVLMDVAVQNVPDKLMACTPVAVKATAGLRKLGAERSDKILAAVRRRLENEYPFPVLDEEHGGVEVMDGRDEGVYAWITANYLLGKIGGPDEKKTAAVFDLGGGSTQIVFQPTFPEAEDGGMPEKMQEGDFKYELAFGGRNFTLYQHSYLGYGLMEARNNLHRLIVETLLEKNPENKAWLEEAIPNPCLNAGTSREIEVALSKGHALGDKVNVNMVGPETSDLAECFALAEKTLKKDEDCKLTPCAFNGVHQPSLAETFATESIYLFSYFYDRTKPLGLQETFTLGELRDMTSMVCAGRESWTVFEHVVGAIDELKGRPEWCLDLNFILALLHKGYEMPLERKVRIAKKIKGNELGWCLGASLPLLSHESGWQCKIDRVSR